MEYLKKYWPYLLLLVIIIYTSKCSFEYNDKNEKLENEIKAYKEREAILREEAKQLRLERAKNLQKIDSLEADKLGLLREIQNIRKDEKEKLDKVDTYSTGELQQFFTDRYGK